MMLPALQFLFSLPILGVLATATPTDPVARQAQSPEFRQRIRDLITNSTGGADIARRSNVFSSSQDGVDSAGFYYSLYNANGAGAGYTEFSDSGEFQIGWNLASSTEFLGGKGYKGGNTRSITWDGYFTAEGDWTLAIYGWTLNPVTEWYIVEAHGTGTPGNGDILGQVSSDGGTYDVYSLPQNNAPEIYGVTSFNQYWSVRRVDHTTGTVDVTTHFNRWKELGLAPGSPIFQMVTLEGFDGQGYLDFTVS